MACNYNIRIGESGRIQIPTSLTSDDEINIESFFTDLANAPKELISELTDQLVQANKTEQDKIIPLSDIDRHAAFIQVTNHLNRIGVPAEVVDNNRMLQEGFPDNTEAGVKSGKIFINEDLATISSPMHEFMHLTLEVLKTTDFKTFQHLIDLIQYNTEYQEIYENLPGQYKSFIEVDQQEEAFARLIEKMMLDQINIDSIENYDEISQILTESIAKTFNIPVAIDLINLLKSPFGNLTKVKSELFIRNKANTTGYLENQQIVIRNGKILNYIKSLVEQNIIQEGECQ